MKKFDSIKEYNKLMEMSEYALADFEKFVGEDAYTIIMDEEEEDSILQVRNKCYWMCERFEGMKFVEV